MSEMNISGITREPEYIARADELGGYDVSGFGRVHHNGP